MMQWHAAVTCASLSDAANTATRTRPGSTNRTVAFSIPNKRPEYFKEAACAHHPDVAATRQLLGNGMRTAPTRGNMSWWFCSVRPKWMMTFVMLSTRAESTSARRRGNLRRSNVHETMRAGDPPRSPSPTAHNVQPHMVCQHCDLEGSLTDR